MPREIVKQPNGLFAVWSTVVDDFIFTDKKPYEIVDILVQEKEGEIRGHITKVVSVLNEGKRYKHYRTYQDCLDYKKELENEEGCI